MTAWEHMIAQVMGADDPSDELIDPISELDEADIALIGLPTMADLIEWRSA